MVDSAALQELKKYAGVKKLSCQLQKDKQAALITSETNIRYLTDFANSEGTLFVTKSAAYLLVDFRYGEAAQKRVTSCEVIVFDNLAETVKDLIKKHNIEEVIIEASDVTVKRAQGLKKLFAECSCQMICDDRLDKLLSNLRIIKSPEEIAQVEKAQRITEEAYLELLNIVKVGVTEAQLALELEFLMRKKGASGVSFDLITIAGKKTSMPHGVPDNSVVQNGDFVTFDIGAVYDGYHSDMTRTIAVGDVSDEQREIYSIVLEAQLAALSKVKSGVKACDVDKTAREIIEKAGYGEYFKHSTGHGVGLEIHEQPFVSPKSSTILSEGMIITVEPGIYLPDKFGVRIEDMVAVTKDACYNFAKLPKDLVVIR